MIPVSIDDTKLVFFDLETSGLKETADILQIAARCEGSEFSSYANPTQPIDYRATSVTGLQNWDGMLFLNGKKVPSIPLPEVLRNFKYWLAGLSRRCILVAHNGALFDTLRLLRAFDNFSMTIDFEDVVLGFSDTLVTLKRLYPQWRKKFGSGGYKLSTLAKNLLQIEESEKFHDAIYDVKILEKISSSFIPREDLIADGTLFLKSLHHERRLQKASKLRQFSLHVLEGIISKEMIRRLALADIDYRTLKEVYEKSGRDGIVKLLTAKQMDNNKPLVTKDRKILEKIIAFLESN